MGSKCLFLISVLVLVRGQFKIKTVQTEVNADESSGESKNTSKRIDSVNMKMKTKVRDDKRSMLGERYSYFYELEDLDEGWWQGRIENLQFCVVLGMFYF